jgi:electron transfer flavoprotein beta subunit
MNITVCIKQVPGSNKVEVDPVTGVLKRDGADSKMNPYDLYALETAVRLKERHGGHISVITMGPPSAEEVIREAFALGADEGYLITDRKFAGADVLATAYTISQGVKMAGHFDVIITGKQTTDGDTAQVGPEMSEYLDIPCIANVISIDSVRARGIKVTMDMQTAIERSYIGFPCLISVDKDIYQPRLPSYVKKKAFKDKPIKRITFVDLADRDESKYGLSGSPTQVKRIFPPAVNDKREMFRGDAKKLSADIAAKLKEHKFI